MSGGTDMEAGTMKWKPAQSHEKEDQEIKHLLEFSKRFDSL